MKACPYCLRAPHWHLARLVSFTRKADHFSFAGCKHADAFASSHAIVPAGERDDYEKRWDANAEKLFAEYTTPRPWTVAMCFDWHREHPGAPLPASAAGLWDEVSIARFRERLWPTPPPLIPDALFDNNNTPTKPADIAAVKAWNEAHRAGDEDFS